MKLAVVEKTGKETGSAAPKKETREEMKVATSLPFSSILSIKDPGAWHGEEMLGYGTVL